MITQNLNIHDVERIEITPMESNNGTVWRYIKIVFNGGILTIAVFPEDNQTVPIHFVED